MATFYFTVFINDMNISFCAKIPISQCQIYDRNANKFVKANLFEVDCKDSSDTELLMKDTGWWNFKDDILNAIKAKIKYLKDYNNLNERAKNFADNNSFFVLQDENQSLVGICSTISNGDSKDIFLLETENEKKYKYLGQSIIASIAKQMLSHSQNPHLTVDYPMPISRNFYINACGFKPKDDTAVYMDKQDMSDFVDTFEKRTRMPIKTL